MSAKSGVEIMNEEQPGKPAGLRPKQTLKLVIGIVAFGLLMGARTELQSIWVRAVVAACAAGVLVWALSQTRSSGA